jgi:hypothetical protein
MVTVACSRKSKLGHRPCDNIVAAEEHFSLPFQGDVG